MKKILENDELGSFCAALGHLVEAGIAMGDALTVLSSDENDKNKKAAFEEMAKGADLGMPLSELLRASGLFPSYAITLVEVGERVGKLDLTLSSLAHYYNGRARMSRRIKASITYPSVLFCILLAVVIVLLVWVLPVFNDVYAQLGTTLTGVAAFLLSVGEVLRYILPVFAVMIALVLAIIAIPQVRAAALGLWKKIAGDKGAFRKINSARFMGALSLGLGSGMTEDEALALASRISESEASGFVKRCKECERLTADGSSLADALTAADLMSRRDRRLYDSGVRSGKGSEVLGVIADDMLEEGEEALEAEVAKIEPAMVAVACVVIGAVLLSVMLPLMNIMNNIG